LDYSDPQAETDPLPFAFDDVVWMDAYGHTLPVQRPEDLISYKLRIGYEEGKHLADVEAVQRYVHSARA